MRADHERAVPLNKIGFKERTSLGPQTIAGRRDMGRRRWKAQQDRRGAQLDRRQAQLDARELDFLSSVEMAAAEVWSVSSRDGLRAERDELTEDGRCHAAEWREPTAEEEDAFLGPLFAEQHLIIPTEQETPPRRQRGALEGKTPPRRRGPPGGMSKSGAHTRSIWMAARLVQARWLYV